MKKFLFLTATCCILSGWIMAQDRDKDFGKINIEEVSKTTYDLDKTAEAVVLYDIGNAFFSWDDDNGFIIIFERSTKIKILSKAGFKYGEIEIPYYKEKQKAEEVYDIEAYTYNQENGLPKISKLDKDNIFNEKTSGNWYNKKFAMPDVKEGSVIEFRYKIESPYFFNFRDWSFQSKIPEVYSEFTFRMIPFYEYHCILQGAAKCDYSKSEVGVEKKRIGEIEYKEKTFVFGMRNVPAFRDEDYITSVNDYIMKMEFQLAVVYYMTGTKQEIITTWPAYIKELSKMDEFGSYMKSVSKSSEDILNSLGISAQPNPEKAKTIFNFVKSNYSWNSSSGKYASQTGKEFMKTKTGNSADINLFLCALLNEAGIQSYPVLLSTRSHGKIRVDYPFEKFINYVIVSARIDSANVMLDATEPLGSFGLLPARCINEKGLIVNTEKTEWTPLVDDVHSEVADSNYIAFNDDLDSAYIDCNLRSYGHNGLRNRNEFQDDSAGFKKKCYAEGMESKGDVNVQNENDPELPFIYDYKASMEVESVGDKLLVVPFPGLTMTENPLKLPSRNYPVDMVYKTRHSFVTCIDIPEDYKYLEQVKPVSIDNNLVSIQYQIIIKDDVIVVSGFYEFKKPVYSRFEYYDLRIYMTKIVETFNDKIVLVKI
jgi:transglutaminase-like putative cysteine protease